MMKLHIDDLARIEKLTEILLMLDESIDIELKTKQLKEAELHFYSDMRLQIKIVLNLFLEILKADRTPADISIPVFLETFNCPNCQNQTIAYAGKGNRVDGLFIPCFTCLSCHRIYDIVLILDEA